MTLPPGLTTRPLRLTDAPAVTAVMSAEELRDTGEVSIEEADIVGDWQRPSFDLAANTCGVFDGERLVGYVERSGADRGDAAVDPAYHGRGIGTFLAHVLENNARAAGSTVVGMPVPQGSPGDRLLEALGYRVRWTSWVLALPEGKVVEDQPLPDGYVVRGATDAEHRDVWTVLEDGFLEWSARERETFEDFSAMTIRRPGYQPWQFRVVVDPAGTVVGAAFVILADTVGYVDRISVRREQRGLGLARALLVDAFSAARDHGATKSELSTDSRTGALGLYERVGMEVTSVWVNRAKDL